MRKVLLFLSALTLSIVPISAAHASGTYTVTVSLNHSKITKGDKVTVSGKVTGGPVSGQTVSITAFEGPDNDAGTAVVGKATLSSTGHYSKSWTPPTGGIWTVKVTKHHSGSTSGNSAFTDVGALKVYRWTSLTNFFDSSETDLGAGPTSKKINGKSYPHSFKIPAGAQLAFEPNEGKFFCSSYEAYVGVADGSLSGVLGNYVALEGPHEIDNQLRHEGHSAKLVQQPMPAGSSASLFHMHAQFDTDAPNNYWVVGNPKGFCAAP